MPLPLLVATLAFAGTNDAGFYLPSAAPLDPWHGSLGVAVGAAFSRDQGCHDSLSGDCWVSYSPVTAVRANARYAIGNRIELSGSFGLANWWYYTAASASVRALLVDSTYVRVSAWAQTLQLFERSYHLYSAGPAIEAGTSRLGVFGSLPVVEFNVYQFSSSPAYLEFEQAPWRRTAGGIWYLFSENHKATFGAEGTAVALGYRFSSSRWLVSFDAAWGTFTTFPDVEATGFLFDSQVAVRL